MKPADKVDWIRFGIVPGGLLLIWDHDTREERIKCADELGDDYKAAVLDTVNTDAISEAKYLTRKMVMENTESKETRIVFLMFLPKYKDTGEFHKIIAHECVHLMDFMLEDICSNQEHEFRAYFHTMVMGAVMDSGNRIFGHRDQCAMVVTDAPKPDRNETDENLYYLKPVSLKIPGVIPKGFDTEGL